MYADTIHPGRAFRAAAGLAVLLAAVSLAVYARGGELAYAAASLGLAALAAAAVVASAVQARGQRRFRAALDAFADGEIAYQQELQTRRQARSA
jgi:hypothetical protein